MSVGMSPVRVANPIATMLESPLAAEGQNPGMRDLAEFLRTFSAAFRRRDQARLFEIYVRGLLHEGSRKSIEAMVRALRHEVTSPVRDLAQALQNFLNQSPWDDRALWRQLRRGARETLGAAPWVGVLDEVSVVKQGDHSVGVQRQYAGDSERKQNCQVAITLTAVAPGAAIPLACRLYLPRNWSNSPSRLRAVRVPEEHPSSASRGEIALELLDEAITEGTRFHAIVAAARFGAPAAFRDNLSWRGIAHLVPADDGLRVHSHQTGPFGAAPVPIRQFRPVGPWSPLEREGEADRPAPMRYAAHRIDVSSADAETTPAWLVFEEVENKDCNRYVALSGKAERPIDLGLLLRSRLRAQSAWAYLKARFGFDHFEGRSWPGFHHHAALVALANWHDFLGRNKDAISQDVVV